MVVGGGAGGGGKASRLLTLGFYKQYIIWR